LDNKQEFDSSAIMLNRSQTTNQDVNFKQLEDEYYETILKAELPFT